MSQNENLISPEQRTEAWYKARAGRFTGSRMVNLFKSDNKAYTDLIRQVAVERITNDYTDNGMDSFALKWGREVEPFASSAYSFMTGNIVNHASFKQHSVYDFVGVSPDGLILPQGGTEFKCPKDSRIHLDRFVNGMDEKEFMPQVQACIWVYDTEWWDWVSFDPRMPAHLKIYMQRVWRDDLYIKNMEKAVLVAEGKVRDYMANFNESTINALLNNYDQRKVS